jgi:hypothetical protein
MSLCLRYDSGNTEFIEQTICDAVDADADADANHRNKTSIGKLSQTLFLLSSSSQRARDHRHPVLQSFREQEP